ncbi:MAG: hypothetical protein IKY26_07665, partial [Erysipelotrichaceae bacterium]|nr:hypothetical protein [Erysipelotrichaceae bacterium]
MMKGKMFKKIITTVIMMTMMLQSVFGNAVIYANDCPCDYDMSKAITEVSVKAWTGEDWYEIPQILIEDAPKIERDAQIKVAISYEPSLLTESYKVSDTITYQLPNGIKATKEQSGDVYDGPTVVGSYKITTDGIIRITITNESYVEDSNGKLKNGKISFDGNLDENAWNEGGKQEIKFGDVKLEVNVKDKEVVTKAVVNVKKTIVETVADKNDPNNAYILYKIAVSTPADNTQEVKNITVEDTFSAGASYISEVTVHTKPTMGTFDVNSKIWTVGNLKPGETKTVTIKAKLNNKVFAAGSTVGDRTITNKAVVKANGNKKNESSVSKKFNSALNITKSNGTYTFDSATGKAKINYTVTVSAPSSNNWPITNVTVTDAFTDNKKYVIKYDNIQVDGTTAKENNTDKKLEWTIGTMNPGDKKILKYEAEIDQSIFLNAGTSELTRQANRTLKNVAKLYTNKTYRKEVNSTENFKKVWINKGGTLLADGRIKFTVKGNQGNPMLNGKLTFTDELSGDWVYDGNVSITKYAISTSGTKTQVGNKETFNVDGKTSWKKEVEGGYYYEFVYYAKYVGDMVGTPSISNKAGVGIGIGGTTYNHYATWQGTSNEFNALAKAFVHRNGSIATWRSEITANIPAGSVYTDYRDSDHEWTFTDQQIANVVVKKGNQTLIKGTDANVADYKIERVDSSSFKITFLKAQSDVSDENPIVISYDTTLKTSDVASGQSAKYVNKAKIETPGGAMDTAQAEHTYLSELKMTKDGGYFNTETGELTWLITVNNTGSMKGEAVVEDVLSPELKFVKAEITSRGSKAGSTNIAAIEAQDNRVVMNITGLNQTNDKNAYIVITLTTIIVDKGFLLGNGEKQFDNEATIRYEGTMATGYAIQKVNNTSLDKEGVYNENTAPNVEYTIRINPNGLNMLQDADTIRVEDTMSTNMMLRSDTLQIKDDDGNVIEPINLKVEGNVFSFNVPDNKALTVTYKAYVSGEVGSEVTISNKVSYYGMAEVPGKEIENKVKIEKSKASIEGAVGFYLVKKDAYDINKILPGTEFTLYELGKNTGKIGVANNKGIVSFVGLDENSIYAFKETKAADNYLIGDNSELTYVAFKKDVVESAKLPEGVAIEDVQIIQSGIALERYNEYNTDTTIRFTGVKTLENANYDLSANEYQFQVTGPNLKDKDGNSVNAVVVSHDKDGKIAFPSIRYELKELADAGSKNYEYTIKEVTGTKAGITYSKDEYKVTVTVSKNEENGLITAKITKVTKNGRTVTAQSVDFVNTYEADDITTTVSGVKKTEGIALKEGAFEFTLVETTKGVNKPYTKTVTNDGKGKFTFELPKYTVKDHGKTFTYEIFEVNKGQDGMTYDESVYSFTVKITDNKQGKLQLEKTLSLGNNVVDTATFTNHFAGSVELTKTNGETGDSYDTLANAEFTLYDSRGYAIGIYTTNEDGYLKVEGLSEGSYYFIETKAPAGYEAELDEDGTTKHYPFTIGLNGTTEVVRANITVSNDKKLGSVSLVKNETDTNNVLADAIFDLYKDGEIYKSGLTTNSEGKIEVSELPWGEYYFVETKAPAGYEMQVEENGEAKQYPFVIGVDGETEKLSANITVDNDKKLGSVSLVKNETDTNNVLADAIFDLYKDGVIYKEGLTTNAEGKIEVSELPWGEYYFVETKAPAGYAIQLDENGEAKQYPFVIGVDGETEKLSANITVENDKKLGSLSLIKKDAITEDVLENVVFDLYKDGEIYKYGLVTDENGMIQVSELPWGEYYFVEVSTIDGYLFDTTSTDIVVIDATYVDGEPLTVEKFNIPTIISFSKVDIADGKEVAGAFLEIYEVVLEELSEDETEDENLVFVTSWLSDGSVHEVYATLGAGKTYVLKETIAPQGYGYIHADIYFTVNEDGSITTEATLAEDENGNAVIMVEDEAIKLEVNKVDVRTNQKLEGAVFAVYDGE